jgi:hypothetical protein
MTRQNISATCLTSMKYPVTLAGTAQHQTVPQDAIVGRTGEAFTSGSHATQLDQHKRAVKRAIEPRQGPKPHTPLPVWPRFLSACLALESGPEAAGMRLLL